MEDWSLEYQVRWYSWIPMTIYGEIVNLFMGMLGLGGLGTGLAGLFGVISLPFDKSMPAWQTYGIFFIELLFAVFLGYVGLRNAWEEILALFTPGLIYEGQLDEVKEQYFSGSHGGYRAWVLQAGDKGWEIFKGSAQGLDYQVRNKQVRIRYRRGTKQITQLWVKAGEHKQHP